MQTQITTEEEFWLQATPDARAITFYYEPPKGSVNMPVASLRFLTVAEAVRDSLAEPDLRQSIGFIARFPHHKTGVRTLFTVGHLFKEEELAPLDQPETNKLLDWMKAVGTAAVVAVRTKCILNPERNNVVIDSHTGQCVMVRPASGDDIFFALRRNGKAATAHL